MSMSIASSFPGEFMLTVVKHGPQKDRQRGWDFVVVTGPGLFGISQTQISSDARTRTTDTYKPKQPSHCSNSSKSVCIRIGYNLKGINGIR